MCHYFSKILLLPGPSKSWVLLLNMSSEYWIYICQKLLGEEFFAFFQHWECNAFHHYSCFSILYYLHFQSRQIAMIETITPHHLGYAWLPPASTIVEHIYANQFLNMCHLFGCRPIFFHHIDNLPRIVQLRWFLQVAGST